MASAFPWPVSWLVTLPHCALDEQAHERHICGYLSFSIFCSSFSLACSCASRPLTSRTTSASLPHPSPRSFTATSSMPPRSSMSSGEMPGSLYAQPLSVKTPMHMAMP